MTTVPFSATVSGMWFVLWERQRDLVVEVHDAVVDSAEVARVVCKECSGVLAQLLDPRDAEGVHLPVVLAVFKPFKPDTALVDIGTGAHLTVTRSRITPERNIRSAGSASVPYYAVMVEGSQAHPVTLVCGNHGERGTITPAQMFVAAEKGRRIRR